MAAALQRDSGVMSAFHLEADIHFPIKSIDIAAMQGAAHGH